MPRMRGARPSPRHILMASTPHQYFGATPDRWCWLPAKVSYWLNNLKGDCVTAEEALNKACSGILISDSTVETWASQHGVLDGADLAQVLGYMRNDGFHQDGNVYNDGPATTVNYRDQLLTQNAIYQGPVKLGVAATQLENVVGESNGWYMTGFSKDGNLDHCISANGYGPIGWLFQQLKVAPPSSANVSAPGVMLFTWNTFGVSDLDSFMNITGEAWVRNPNTLIVGTSTPTPDPVYTPGPITPPPPPPPPSPTTGVRAAVDAVFNRAIAAFWMVPKFQAVLRDMQRQTDAILAAGGITAVKGGHVPAEIIAIIDGAFAAAATAYPQYSALLIAAKAIIDTMLPQV